MDRLSQLYEDITQWTANYRAAHASDDRSDLDIWLDASVYNVDSPYWPVQQED